LSFHQEKGMLQRAMFFIGVFLCLGTSPAAAHGEEPHARKPAKGVPKEQTAWGIAGDADEATKTVTVRMADTMRFEPDRMTVRVGETVRFVIHNDGKLMHEMVIGTKPVLDKHAELMRRFPNMEHDEPYMAHVAPGKHGEIVWKFNRAGEFDFGCLVGGHYESGMVGKVNVVH
jgi:uncharacterized cupredoxin-like copper-binding protein